MDRASREDPRCWIIHCDGSAVPNPGHMGLGAVLTAPDGTRHALSQATHATGCNNEAELLALMMALRQARACGATAVLAYSDNSILVEQLGGVAPRPVARLAPLFDKARALLQSFDSVRFAWIPRHRNHDADALARAAQGLAPKRAPRRKKAR